MKPITPQNILLKISSIIGDDIPFNYHEDQFEDIDWVTHTQSKFKDIKISNSLKIIPPWQSHDVQDEIINIIIYPGSGFGIGKPSNN